MGADERELLANSIADAITKLDQKPEGTVPLRERMKSEMEKMIEDLIPEVFGDKIDEIVSDIAEEKVMQFLKVLRGPEGKAGQDGEDGKTPMRGVDFLTDEELNSIQERLRPQKGVDYSDGKNGESVQGPLGPRGLQGIPGKPGSNGRDGRNGIDIKAKEIRDRLQELRGFDRLDASAIKNLPKGGGISRGGGASVRRETPGGAVNGSNVTFTLAELPRADDAILLFVNGQFMTPGTGNDYTRSARTLTLTTAPQTGANVRVWYLK